MPPHIYHILHLAGVLFVFAGIGSFLTNSGTARPGMKFHGIGLLLLLVAGFGMLAKLKLSYSAPWVIAKMVIWLLLGVLPVLAKKRVLQPGVLVLLGIVLGLVAASLGYLKPA
ncbi:MAG: hypothetical protein K1X78_08650 [Verrucomicrobiaceae bacterium]|nr:hypothetical protein [Verrucomicrobiaceae bacterium]